MKKFLIFLLIPLLCYTTACSRDDDQEPPQKEINEDVQQKPQDNNQNDQEDDTPIPEKKDEYYVRYTAKYSRHLPGVTVYRNEKNKLVTVEKSNFEMVIGPVEKGFEAYLGGSNPNALIQNSRKIEISKNGGVFMTKATGAYSLTYKIDF